MDTLQPKLFLSLNCFDLFSLLIILYVLSGFCIHEIICTSHFLPLISPLWVSDFTGGLRRRVLILQQHKQLKIEYEVPCSTQLMVTSLNCLVSSFSILLFPNPNSHFFLMRYALATLQLLCHLLSEITYQDTALNKNRPFSMRDSSAT